MINPQNLKAFIEKSGVFFKENSVSFIFTCPRCNKLKKLYIRKKDGVFVCWKCKESGFKGKAEYALAELTGRSIDVIRHELYPDILDQADKRYIELALNDFYDIDSLDFGIEELPEVSINPEFVKIGHPSFKAGLNYFKSRGITEEHINIYNLMYHPAWKAVVFPVINDGRLVGWQERGIDRDFKYTLKGFKKEETLMFRDRLYGSDHAVLCEGPIDGLKANLCGGNVVSMGKGVSDTQLNYVFDSVKKLYLGLDPDAYIEIDKICRKAYGELQVFQILPTNGKKDLGEMTQEEVYEQYKLAKPIFGKFFFYIKR